MVAVVEGGYYALSGGGFDRIVSFHPDQSVKADLLSRLLVAEAAQANRVLAWLRHEPSGLGGRLLFLAPSTLDSVLGYEGGFSHSSGE